MTKPKTMDTRKIVSLPAGLAEAIENYRFDKRLKSEADAIRLLLKRGLKAEGVIIPEGEFDHQ